jgi:hypothetical protein
MLSPKQYPEAYVWEEGSTTVIEMHKWGDARIIAKISWIYDPSDEAYQQWGTWTPGMGWKAVPIEEVPAQFKAMLMLLGVTFT